ncbi:MAG: acetylglutamate kinase [Bacteroidales bacterium]|nr:acetylglutamate kinase [Bacteroidales bacterium]
MMVFKIGGNVVEDEAALRQFCRDFAALEGPKVLIHGGGVMASGMQRALGQEPVKIEGRRVTDAETLKVVTMVYAGWCNKHVTALLQAAGCHAIGLAGCDGSVITARRRPPRTLLDGQTVVDYGYVGDVTPASVNVSLLESLAGLGLVPVLCAINHDGEGNLLNTNADTVASSVAAALGASLVCCFEYDGVLRDRRDPGSVIPLIRAADFAQMCAAGIIADGMIPKIENCLAALRAGAAACFIRNAASPGAGGTQICL